MNTKPVLRQVSVQILLPSVIKMGDYHDFDLVDDILQRIGLKNLIVEEIGCYNKYYYAVIHEGSVYDKTFIKELSQELEKTNQTKKVK
jgi:hypothetical protein